MNKIIDNKPTAILKQNNVPAPAPSVPVITTKINNDIPKSTPVNQNTTGTPSTIPITKCTSKQTSTVSPAEVCTLEVAKKLGISDAKEYFKDPYDTIQTFNNAFDEKSDKRYDKLCYKSSTKKEAYPNCILEHGFGFIRKPGFPDKCITFACPPGFKLSEKGDGCIKTSIDATVVTSTKCSERLHDWFTIPNYHLGNKYQSDKEKQCYEPCKKGYIPSYSKDPVDQSAIDFSSEDNLNKCINKYQYFGGKYRDTPDYCPIAIIKNLGSTKELLQNEYLRKLEPYRKNATNSFNDIEKSYMRNIINTIQENAIKTESDINDFKMPDGEYLKACRTLHTEEHLAETYSICNELSNDDSKTLDYLIRSGLSVGEAKIKLLMLKNACNGVFCNPNDDAGAVIAETIWPPPDKKCKPGDKECKENVITGEPICFKEVENVNLDKELAALKKEQTKADPVISSDSERYALNNSFKYMLLFIIVPILILTLYGIYTELLYPKIILPIWYNIILPIIRRIKYIFTGFKGSVRQDVLETQLSAIQSIPMPKIKK